MRDRVRDLVAEVDHAELRLEVAEHAERPGRARSAPARRRTAPPTSPCRARRACPRRARSRSRARRGGSGAARRAPGSCRRSRAATACAACSNVIRSSTRAASSARCAWFSTRWPGSSPISIAVAIEHRGREPVVVRDLGLLALGQLEGRERPAHSGPQVLGGLVRERQAQHVARHHALWSAGHAPERDEREVDHARGHHRGLARSGAGDQHAGFERPGDRGPLLVRGLGAEGVDDRLRVALGHGGHDLGRRDRGRSTGNTALPCGNSGHRVLKSHQKQSAFGFGAVRLSLAISSRLRVDQPASSSRIRAW